MIGDDATKDLRLPALGFSAWVGALLGPFLTGSGPTGWRVGAGVAAALAVGGLLGWGLRGRRATALATALVALGVGAVGALHTDRLHHNPVSTLALQRAQVRFVATVSSDPRPVIGAHSTGQMLSLQIHRLTGRGTTYSLSVPVLAFGDDAWAGVRLGATVRGIGRLAPADADDVAAVLDVAAPTVVARPGVWWRASGALRAAIREAVAQRPQEQRALVPALVDGDDAGVPDDLADDFRATGLTHLMAVSGTNLTLLVGFLLIVARWCRVRGRWLHVVGAVGIIGFVVLARTEPSVVRAAAMGAVGLLAMGHNGRQRALRGLGASVVGLLLLDPGLARSVGFALSVMATAGILLLGPWWRDALARWLPRWVAEAIAVPAAAQVACTPLIAAISGRVSLVAVVANLLAEPAVAPATVLGLLGGLLGLVIPVLGRLVGTPASWCVGWIILVAHRCAAFPRAEIGWGSGPMALGVLVVVCVVVAVTAPRLLHRRVTGAACCLVVALAVLLRAPTPGWPPPGWVFVMCDVGQGDGLVLNSGLHSAVVVDAGPDPDAMDRCLDDLQIETVPLLLFTHFDADHVTGVEAVFAGRRVGQLWTTALRQPPHGVALVEDAAAAAGITPQIAPYAATETVGGLTFQVIWPRPSPAGPTGQGTETNAASVVLLVQTHGLRLLLTGDLEPESQAAIAREVPGLHVDVLKVPHHGSRYQDEDWLLSLKPTLALTSVGADNDYGHPAASTLGPLAAAGVAVYRTDQDGSIAVVARSSGPVVATH